MLVSLSFGWFGLVWLVDLLVVVLPLSGLSLAFVRRSSSFALLLSLSVVVCRLLLSEVRVIKRGFARSMLFAIRCADLCIVPKTLTWKSVNSEE